MKRLTTIAELRRWRSESRRAGTTVALVPTMGALHEGHLRLIDVAAELAGQVVVSVFVNPLQFAPTDDLERYPRDIERDARLAQSRGATLLFTPTESEMYGDPAGTRVVPGPGATRWEGTSRPGHFEGVLTVVAKLFNIVEPDFAVFGRKDIQQSILIRRMVRDLDFNVAIVVAETVREPDGLALSSRNAYLTAVQHGEALAISRALRAARQLWEAGERNGDVLTAAIRSQLDAQPGVEVEYIAVADPDRLEPVGIALPGTVLAIAARLGSTRLIDNTILGSEEL